MRLNAHMSFNGDCEAAFRMYAACLGGEITCLLRHSDAPAAGSYPGSADKIVHATLKVGHQVLTGADVAPEAYEKPRGFAVQLNLDQPEEARRIFEVLAEKGTVSLPLHKTFWARHYAVLPDRFGVPWEINCP